MKFPGKFLNDEHVWSFHDLSCRTPLLSNTEFSYFGCQSLKVNGIRSDRPVLLGFYAIWKNVNRDIVNFILKVARYCVF